MKIDCTQCGPELAPYAAEELDAGTRASVAEHLADCPDCRRELARERDLRRSLASLPPLACPPEVGRRVLAAVAAEQAAARRRRWTAGAGVGLAAAALAGALLLRPGAPVAPTTTYSPEQIAAARRELIQTVTLTARVLDQAGRGTIANVFSERLPAAVAGSLRLLDDPTRGG